MTQQTPANPAFDPGRKFVRVTGLNPRGFVEFEFAVGGPEMFVELTLPTDAFDAFCITQNVVRLGSPGTDFNSDPATLRSNP
ncbi:phenol hydroxylase subunit [Cupriavidus necator]|uniref:phenol hydroxylase subunit n=1 Tax=Cupriavidus necator TaxID=106590 RepID=UPI0005B3EC7B|nr:phenol hydroxylase subunit [Cupriavidus necator]